MRGRKYGRLSGPPRRKKRKMVNIEKRRTHTGRKVKDPKNVEELDKMAEGTYGDTPV